MMEIELTSVEEAEYPLLVEVWEDSVRATHDFLRPADREFYRTRMPFYLRSVCLTAARTADSRIVAFLGTDEDRIEMLFVYSAYRGCGIGKRLITHAIHALGCRCEGSTNRMNRQQDFIDEWVLFLWDVRPAMARGCPIRCCNWCGGRRRVATLRNNP
ncbi:GNAT family N-acetyltransferase [Millionella massiliensis]|uniref:GNAT family N-acetyltransferase n=1 Tax=Millionella massiliensis TaxID=1871023 RepID=UPI0023A8C291|nr:GNAT family N-acetyltransferase [Millionella massiliensis]